ncbi:MAG: type II toxin-antitoxin system PemK/MazF family toxin [Alphaproteobacteria bacterium]|nr:type II toxin-antitoxin system PemK/MazF family toxin [Alphaproteobacteria bacterium]
MTSRRARFRPFDVVVVPFPYADRLAEKRRPALVVSNERLETAHGLVWLAMITSAKNAPWPEDVAINDLAEAGLPSASVVRPAKVATVDAARILRRAGRLAGAERKAVASAIGDLLADR